MRFIDSVRFSCTAAGSRPAFLGSWIPYHTTKPSPPMAASIAMPFMIVEPMSRSLVEVVPLTALRSLQPDRQLLPLDLDPRALSVPVNRRRRPAERQRLGGDRLPMRLDGGLELAGVRRGIQDDAVLHLQVRALAKLLDVADHLAGHPLAGQVFRDARVDRHLRAAIDDPHPALRG